MIKKIIKTTSLQIDGQLAIQNQIPLLLMFSQNDCPFCIKLKEEIIQPMLISGDYTDRALIREFMIDDNSTVINFQGESVEPRDIFNHYKLFVTPSLLLLDGQGNELAERQVGINTIDYYGYYLDEAIKVALTKIHYAHAGDIR